jgi:hypothetical protein
MATRILVGTVRIEGTDDEWWPQSDEHVAKEFPVHTILSDNQPAATVQIPHVGWGGECRVEMDLEAVLGSNKEIKVTGEARLYEGTTESTDDLEDTKGIDMTVPRLTVNHTDASTEMVQLRNTETWGGDHAEIYLRFLNVSEE